MGRALHPQQGCALPFIAWGSEGPQHRCGPLGAVVCAWVRRPSLQLGRTHGALAAHQAVRPRLYCNSKVWATPQVATEGSGGVQQQLTVAEHQGNSVLLGRSCSTPHHTTHLPAPPPCQCQGPQLRCSPWLVLLPQHQPSTRVRPAMRPVQLTGGPAPPPGPLCPAAPAGSMTPAARGPTGAGAGAAAGASANYGWWWCVVCG